MQFVKRRTCQCSLRCAFYVESHLNFSLSESFLEIQMGALNRGTAPSLERRFSGFKGTAGLYLSV